VLNTYNLIAGFDHAYGNIVAGLGEIYAEPNFADGELHEAAGSPAIDAGDWASAYANEPAPNGGRINLGTFGNTAAASQSIPIVAPAVSLTTNGTNVTATWGDVPAAAGYTLFYAPYPEASYIGSLEMGTATSLSVELWPGAAFYVAVKAYNATDISEYSNIESFQIPLASTP